MFPGNSSVSWSEFPPCGMSLPFSPSLALSSLRLQSVAILMMSTGTAESMSEVGQACSRAVPGLVGGRPALKLRRRKYIT